MAQQNSDTLPDALESLSEGAETHESTGYTPRWYTRYFDTVLPLYATPNITLRLVEKVDENGQEVICTPTIAGLPAQYIVPKGLLTRNSPVLRAMFSDQWMEGRNGIVNIPIMEGVISKASMEMFLFLCLRETLPRFTADEIQDQKRYISVLLEVARLSDMWGMTVTISQEQPFDYLIAEQIRGLIIAGRSALERSTQSPECTKHIPHSLFYTPKHLDSAWMLPSGHPVREMFLLAAVVPYLLRMKDDWALVAILEKEGAAVRLLELVGDTLAEIARDTVRHEIFDPFSREIWDWIV
ncbi:hypothetical protein HYFRA_00004028 [Hymenoscyphus fraxineus]|uniref:BTB domain-containing protein n=1 Tax=Hymenoscyphus fraxineus TaxID=746836 RepID=A0A9N9KPF3_9HELO|nr:hypothetical protein HYFRA_00004028 [Hymenoscyphus fraxineus]